MKLITSELARKIPSLEKSADKTIDQQHVYVKLFNPCGSQTWYIVAYDKATKEAFGFVDLGDSENAELGYISISELENLRLPMGLKIERDLWFEKMPLKEVMEKIKIGQHV